MLLHNKHALVLLSPKHDLYMGESVSVLAHLAMKRILQVIARLKFIP